MAEESDGSNGRVTIREVYGLLEKVYARIDTVAALGVAAHKENLAVLADLDTKVDEHLTEAAVFYQRVEGLESFKEELPRVCLLRHIAELNRLKEAMSRNGKEPDDSEIGDIRRFWRVAKWFVGGTAIVVANALILDAIIH